MHIHRPRYLICVIFEVRIIPRNSQLPFFTSDTVRASEAQYTILQNETLQYAILQKLQIGTDPPFNSHGCVANNYESLGAKGPTSGEAGISVLTTSVLAEGRVAPPRDGAASLIQHFAGYPERAFKDDVTMARNGVAIMHGPRARSPVPPAR